MAVHVVSAWSLTLMQKSIRGVICCEQYLWSDDCPVIDTDAYVTVSEKRGHSAQKMNLQLAVPTDSMKSTLE